MGYLKDFFSLIYPDICDVCNKSLFKHEKIICTQCYHHLARTRFAEDKGNPAAQVFWGRVPLQWVVVVFLYNKGNALQQLIHSFKYRGHKQIGIFLGEELGKEINDIDDLNDISCIIPVPLHPKKKKKRGFNQSEVIATGIAKKTNIQVDTGINTNHGCPGGKH